MKTPEEMAIRYSDLREFADRRLDHKAKMLLEQGFLAGYQAAKDEDQAKMQELKANWTFCCEDKARLLKELAVAERANDQLADAGKVMNSPEKLDSSNSSNNSNGWISVKDRLPEYTPMVLAMCTDGYELAYYGMYGQGWTNTLGTEHLNVTHWHLLPAPPKEDR